MSGRPHRYTPYLTTILLAFSTISAFFFGSNCHLMYDRLRKVATAVGTDITFERVLPRKEKKSHQSLFESAFSSERTELY